MSRILILAFSVLLACAQPERAGVVDGPQRVAEEWNDAVRRGDYGAMHDLTRPQDRAILVAFKLMILGMLGTDNELGEEQAALRKRHGLGPPPHFPALAIPDENSIRTLAEDYLKSVPDERALYIDVARAFRAFQPQIRFGEAVLWEIDGDNASAFMGGKRVEFERVEGRWYLANELEESESVSVDEADR